MNLRVVFCMAAVSTSWSIIAAVALALPDCDGTNPTTGTCGTETVCLYSWPSGGQSTPPTCVGNHIIPQSGQFACTSAPNPAVGSTAVRHGHDSIDGLHEKV